MKDIDHKTIVEQHGWEYHYPFGPMLTTSHATQEIVDGINAWADQAFVGTTDSMDMSPNLVGNQTQELLVPEDVVKDTGLWMWLVRNAQLYWDAHVNTVPRWNSTYALTIPQLKNVGIISVWCNQAFAGDYNAMHNHSGHLSGILYLKFPEEIYDEQSAGKLGNDKMNKNHYNGSTQIVSPSTIGQTFNNHTFDIQKPTPGDFVMFPSWTYHQVWPFATPGVERRTLSFNIGFKLGQYKGEDPRDAMHNKD